jgi:predicted nucleic acid-binding protein
MTILVSDTSVLINLERGELIASAFKLSATFAVPDVLYERELRDYGGEDLVRLGLRIESLDGDGVEMAMRHRQVQRQLTVPDSFALALAKRNGWTLLTGDGPLRELARAEGVDCHGVLWLLDEFETQGAATYVKLHDGLEKISDHPRCRLPKREVANRLSRYVERL